MGTSKLENVTKFFQIINNVCKKLLLHFLVQLGWNGKKHYITTNKINKKGENKMKSKKIIGSILLCTMLGYATPVFAVTKEETVYSKLNNNGTQYETIVNEHIRNDELLKTIDDISNLLDITNVGGNETFEQKENKIIWNADEKDIYYQGKTENRIKKWPIILCSIFIFICTFCGLLWL